MRSSRGRVALALWTLLAGTAWSSTAASEGYLLPIVRGFANNEVTGLKETLALGQLLGRTVILTGIIESSLEQLRGADPRVIPFESIFDPGPISGKQRVTFLAQPGRPGGWNGTVDLIAQFYGKGSDDLWLKRWQDAFKIPVQHVPRKNYIAPYPFRCTAENLTALRKDFEGHEVVAIFSYLGVVRRSPGHEWGNDSPDGRNTAKRPLTQCQQAYAEGTKLLVKAPFIRQIVTNYINTTFGKEPFAALHVRPFPDTCLKVWQGQGFDEAKANRTQICERPGQSPLHQVLGPAVSTAMKVLGVDKLFVMAHPGIRHHVDRMLGLHGITAHYLAAETTQSARNSRGAMDWTEHGGDGLAKQQPSRHRLLTAANTSRADNSQYAQSGVVSLLGMVEQEVAVRAKVFIASYGESSMAGMVMQERHAGGASPHSTLAFEQLGRLPRATWPPPWSK